jgi:hypothetical protein
MFALPYLTFSFGSPKEKVTKRKGDFFQWLRLKKEAIRCYVKLLSSMWRWF